MDFSVDLRFNLDFTDILGGTNLNNIGNVWNKNINITIEGNQLKIHLNGKTLIFTIDSFIDNDIIARERILSGLRKHTKKNRIDFLIKSTECVHNFFLLEWKDEGEIKTVMSNNKYKHTKSQIKYHCQDKKYNFLSLSLSDINYVKLLKILHKEKEIIQENIFLNHSNDYIRFKKDTRDYFYIKYSEQQMYGFGGVFAINEYEYILPISYVFKSGKKYKIKNRKSKKKYKKLKKKSKKIVNK